MKRITKKHLLYALFVFSIVGNICFYMGKQKAKQEVISVTEELTEKTKEYEAVTSELAKNEEELAATLSELTEKEEEVTVPEIELSEEKSDEKAMFAEVAAADYLEASRHMTSIHSATLDRLVNTYHLYDDTDDMYPELIDTAMIPTADGKEKELFIIRHVDKSNEEMAPFWALANSLILVDYKNGTDELLFQIENKEIERLDDIVTYYEYFDMEVQDVDGNGEEDFVLLIGGHCIYSGTPEWLEIFCLIGLQEKGEIHVISSDKEDWLREVIKSLYEIDEENIKVDIFLDDVKLHFGNGKTEAEQKADKDDNAGNQLETYIASKEEQMSEWTFYNSRYFDQELLWESHVYDESNHVKKLKIYKEHGDRGNTMHQIALYLYDFTTGEVEKQSVAGIFAEVMEERLLEFKDVELKDILYEDLNGDGISDIKMTVACIIEDSAGRETEELYEIIHWYQADNGKFVCRGTEAEQAVIAYRQFIDGRRSINGGNIYELAMPTGEPDRRYPTSYAIIDVNGDGIPELNIQTAREFNVYSFENGEITFLGLFMPSLYGYCILKNGAYMCYSDRFSTCSYSYFELDGKGNQINELGFYWNENNGNYIPDEEDDFFFDGNACSMEEWYDRTRKYLYTDRNGREQIRNQVEWTTYCEADPFETNGQVHYEGRHEYQLTLYDKEQNELLSESYPESMWIDGVAEDVWEIGILADNSSNYTYYFNKETAQISDTFCNAIVVGDKYISYMKDDASDREERTLILSDIFEEGILYQEITRDFSKTAEPMSAVISIEMIDDETVRLEYYQGENYAIVCEDISIQPILTSYRIQDKHITNRDVAHTEYQLNICCPQIIYPDAQDIAEKINQSIEEQIMKECDIESSSYDLDYEVKYRGEECLSILFWGMRYDSGAHTNDIALGLTYDMTTGRLLHIMDIIEKDKLQQKLEQKDFEQQHGIKVYYYEKDVAQEEVNWFDTYWLNQYVSEKSSYEEGEHKTDFYLTSDKIGILYEVGHSLGDYIVLEMERTIGAQSNEESPEVYYRILSQGMAVEGEGREYSKDEIMADSEMPLIFKTILCGDFENIPWGDKTLDDEKDIYYEEYQNRETWQFLLKDLDGDDREELMIRNEEGRLMIFYEQWGDMEGTEGRFYWCTMGEGDEDSNILKMLQDEHNEIPSSYRCDIYLNNGLLAGFSRYMRNGHTDIYCDIEKGTEYGTKQYLEKCWIRTINNYEEYQSYLKYYNVSYEEDDDRSKMTHNGTYYFIDGEMVSGEDVEAWLEEKVWQQMIPAEEWGIVP